MKAKDSSSTYMTVPEAANYLRTDRKTIYRMIAASIIPAYRLSERKTLLKREELDKYLEKRRF